HYMRLKIFARNFNDALDEIEHLDRVAGAEVERFASYLFNPLGQQQISSRNIVRINELSQWRPIASDNRRPVVENRKNRTRDNARQVCIARAVDVRETRNSNGRFISVRK